MKNGLLLCVLMLCVLLSSAQEPENTTTTETSAQEPETTTATYQQNQDEKKGFDPSRLYYGGYVNMSLGSVTSIGVAPLVGYKITSKWSVGSQITYEYYKDKRFDRDFSSSNYGLSVFNRYRFVPQLYGHVEFEAMNYELYWVDGGSDRKWVPFLYVGGGFSQPISNNVWFNAQLLFDVLQDKNSPYKDWEPFYSIGFGIGF